MSSEHKIVWDDQTVSRLWNYYSRTPPYSEIYFSKVFGDRILNKSRVSTGKEISILDFGCGPGFIWEHIQKLGITSWDYTGLDFSPDSAEKLRAKASGHPRFKGAIHASQLPTSLPANHFDVVFLFEVVEHLNDAYLEGTLKEVHRVLKPGGQVIITTPNEEDLSVATKFCPECNAIFHEWQHVRSWSASTLSNYLHSRGFDRRFATAVDFSEHGWFRRLTIQARRLAGRYKRPHLIAGFQKT